MSREIPSEQKDRVIKAATELIESHRQQKRAMTDYSVEVKHWLERQSGVARAQLRGRNSITVEFEDESQVVILLDSERTYGSRRAFTQMEQAPVGVFIAPQDLAKQLMTWQQYLELMSNTPGTTNALIFDPLYDDWFPESTTDQIETLLEDAGYSVDKVLGNNGTLANLAEVEDGHYGVIFMRSHGAMEVVGGENKLHIMTRPYYDSWPNPAASGFDGVGVFHLQTQWGWKYALTFNEQFVRHHLGGTAFPDTLMHLLVCSGAHPESEDDMIDAFLDAGVGCYTGWTDTATVDHGDPAAVAFFEYLCGAAGRRVSGAIHQIESLGHSPDSWTGAELVAHGDATLCLRGLITIVVRPDPREIALIQELPREAIEIVIDLGDNLPIDPDISPWGGKLAAVDLMGRRRFIPNLGASRILTAEDVMENAARAPVR